MKGVRSFLGLFFFTITVYVQAKDVIYIVPFGAREENDLLFIKNDPILNRDDMAGNFFALRESLNKLGYEIKLVSSVKGLTNVQSIICLDVPTSRVGIFSDLLAYPLEKRVLIIFEPPSVRPDNYDRNYHHYFGKIYTLMDDWVDNKKYFKFYETQPTLSVINEYVPFLDKKLCVILAGGNHSSPHPHQLYTAREDVINYFERNAPDDLDFYGARWETTTFGKYKVYKGYAISKLECLKNYRFCICYENMYGLKGYVTAEKILYCFVTGCVPVYWGAPNITDYIPKDCFIDRRDFGDISELHAYLKSMPQEVYESYLTRIEAYLKSAQVLLFSREYFIDIIARATIGNYDWNLAFSPEQMIHIQKLYESPYGPQ